MATFLLIFRFFEVIRIGMTNFTQVLFPSISMRQASGDWNGVYDNFKLVFLRVFALSLLIFPFIFWKGYDVFVWWSDYYNSESLSTFQVYALYVFFLVIDHVAVIFLLALKFNKIPAIVSILQSVLSLFATILFIQKIGLSGAVWASLLLFGLTSLIFNPLYLMHQLRKRQVIL
jgi:O-antigen/teichoic acid export membrane protein